MEPLYTMSRTELARLQALEALSKGQVTQARVADALGLSVRQVKRLAKAYRLLGPDGVLSARRGKPSNHRSDPTVLAAAIERVRERYADFGPTLASEKLALDGIFVKRERLRQAMIAAGIWRAKQRRRIAVHSPRLRRPQFGELIQGDGSPHDWFEGRAPRCSLLLFVDDATSCIGAALFAPHESTEAYFQLMEQYLQSYGKPYALYVDKLSVFKVSRHQEIGDQTQFARAMNELDIELICANSPQAKGRVERANRTLQDRLVKELRLQNISSIADANAFLPQFLAGHNARFAIAPASDIDAHRPLGTSENLQRILVHTEERVVSPNLTVKFKGALFQLTAPGLERRIAHQRVWIRQLATGVSMEYRGQILTHQELPRAQRPVVDAKSLNAVIDRTRLGARTPNPQKQRILPPSHPWKRYPTLPQPPK